MIVSGCSKPPSVLMFEHAQSVDLTGFLAVCAQTIDNSLWIVNSVLQRVAVDCSLLQSVHRLLTTVCGLPRVGAQTVLQKSKAR